LHFVLVRAQVQYKKKQREETTDTDRPEKDGLLPRRVPARQESRNQNRAQGGVLRTLFQYLWISETPFRAQSFVWQNLSTVFVERRRPGVQERRVLSNPLGRAVAQERVRMTQHFRLPSNTLKTKGNRENQSNGTETETPRHRTRKSTKRSVRAPRCCDLPTCPVRLSLPFDGDTWVTPELFGRADGVVLRERSESDGALLNVLVLCDGLSLGRGYFGHTGTFRYRRRLSIGSVQSAGPRG
jgi:hypothetical protein